MRLLLYVLLCPCMKHDRIRFFCSFFLCRVFVSVWVWLTLYNRMPHLPIRSEMVTRLSNRILEQGLLQRLEAPVIDLTKCPSQPISSKTRIWLTCFVNPFPIKVHGYNESQSNLSNLSFVLFFINIAVFVYLHFCSFVDCFKL